MTVLLFRIQSHCFWVILGKPSVSSSTVLSYPFSNSHELLTDWLLASDTDWEGPGLSGWLIYRHTGWLADCRQTLIPYWAFWAYWVDWPLIFLQCRQTKAGLFLWEPAGSGCHSSRPGQEDRGRGESELDEETDVLRGKGEDWVK